uniref:Ion_trans_2 domain-containing protein n=1 Tax=Panagrellus redivivus TaxID=6233 RepID=A0A7E4UM34_PANRE
MQAFHRKNIDDWFLVWQITEFQYYKVSHRDLSTESRETTTYYTFWVVFGLTVYKSGLSVFVTELIHQTNKSSGRKNDITGAWELWV